MMKLRYIPPLLVVLIVACALTTFVLVQRRSVTGFAEITFKNLTPDTIKSVWLQRSSLELREHDIKHGEQKSIRFYVDERNPDHTCQIRVTFDDGDSQACDVEIRNGEKSTIYVYVDRLESDILKHTTPEI